MYVDLQLPPLQMKMQKHNKCLLNYLKLFSEEFNYFSISLKIFKSYFKGKINIIYNHSFSH